MDVDRIIDQAKNFELFSSIEAWTEANIEDFIKKHHYHFLLYEKKGYGLWIWKPYIILKRLLQIDEGDYLLYVDAGVHLNSFGRIRFQEYLNYLKSGQNYIVAFQANDLYKGKFYVKADCVKSYFPDYYLMDLNAYYAGIILLKNNEFSRKLINDWLALCENTEFLSSSRSIIHVDPPFFRGQDADNGLFNLVIGKFQSSQSGIVSIYPDEVNLYHKSGKQLFHQIPYSDYLKADWGELIEFPFQVRRDRPPTPSNISFKNKIGLAIKRLLKLSWFIKR
jgi:hypothetical protein